MKRLYFWLVMIITLILLISMAFSIFGDDVFGGEETVEDEAKVAVTILDNREGIEDSREGVDESSGS
ncbi:hypothetical protein HN903_02990 [archaeon]|jgi:hypothetical protein|nr:hypothetical protein [archaeon]MBT7128697.1 hypothetical protein [archaeon]